MTLSGGKDKKAKFCTIVKESQQITSKIVKLIAVQAYCLDSIMDKPEETAKATEEYCFF